MERAPSAARRVWQPGGQAQAADEVPRAERQAPTAQDEAAVNQADRTRGSAILARLDRLPPTRHVWLLIAMLSLVMPREGWHPPVVRTVATENKGIDVLRETIGKFRKHFEASGERQKKHVEHWKKRLIELLESRLLEKALGGAEGQKRLERLASEVAQRKKDPFAAVKEILASSGIAD